MSTYGPAGPVNPPGGESQPNPWEEETRPYQNPAPSSVPPAAPASPAYGQPPVSPPAAYPQPVSGQPQPVSPPPAYPSVPQYQATQPVGYPPAPQPAAPQYQPQQPVYPSGPQQPGQQYQPPQQSYPSPTAPYPPVSPPQYQAPEPGYAQPNAGMGQQNYSVGQASASAAVPRPYDQGYAQSDYDQQWPAEPKKRNTAVIVLSVLLGLVLIGGGATAAYLYTHKSSDTPPAPPKAQTCVVSDNGQPNPKMIPANCGPGTFQILNVFTGTADTQSCASVSGVTNYYTFTWPPNSAYDYVLCLKKQ